LPEAEVGNASADDHWQNCTTVCPNGTVVPSYKVVHKSNGQSSYDYQPCVNATGGKVPGARQIPWYHLRHIIIRTGTLN
jgi:hypothetical protein